MDERYVWSPERCQVTPLTKKIVGLGMTALMVNTCSIAPEYSARNGLADQQSQYAVEQIEATIPTLEDTPVQGTTAQIVNANIERKVRSHEILEQSNEPDQQESIADEPDWSTRYDVPIFTVQHTVAEGESLSAVAERYYDSQLYESGWALRALLDANKDRFPDPDHITPHDVVSIPISEPVAVRLEAGNTMEQVAEHTGFHIDTLLALNRENNQADEENIVYLPVQAYPELGPGESLYTLPAQNDPCLNIPRGSEIRLPTVKDRVLARADRLSSGHILVARSYIDEIDQTDDSGKLLPSRQEILDEIHSLQSARPWSTEIDRNYDDIEQQITKLQIAGIELSQERCSEVLSNINRDYAGVFEDARTVYSGVGIIEKPRYFVMHHTAHGYPPGLDGVRRFNQGMIKYGLSVQWLIDRDANIYQLTRNPRQAAHHAAGVNDTSTGVEIMTDETRSQGSLTDEQLEASLYLAYYVTTHVYGYSPAKIAEVVVGHRHINDRLRVGSNAKPDFFSDVMEEAVHPKLEEFITGK